MKPQLIIFDLDGTLIDSRKDLAAGINHMRVHYELEPLPLETIVRYIGNGVRRLVEGCLQGADVDVDEAVEVNKAYYYANLTDHTTLYDGVVEGVRRLADAGHRIAVLTNKPGDPSREILRHFGLAECFTVIIGGGDTARLKPEPDGIVHCMELAGMDATQTWMVGDHYTDLAVAENAGVRSAYVTYGFGEERGYKPNVYFASFPELVGYFV
ncbi:MAG: HAD-IA family hydrolase [Pontiellaceae bacterium]|nr:HAD-IA family hydrolase [Pontiellaceae bacterium]MBN2785568.1 HAD-IA family hydrolase [Pontiellaceae bacterium]